MTQKKWNRIWIEQCEAAEAIRQRHGIEPAFDCILGEKRIDFARAATGNDEFARALPQFVSRVRNTFSLQEIDRHLARIEHRRRERDEGAAEYDDLPFEDPDMAARRARQFELVKGLQAAPAFGTS